MWHTAAVVAEPDGSSPYSLQHSPLKVESSGPADLLGSSGGGGGGGGGSFAELAGPPASPAHAGPSHNRNNSTSSAFSEVRLTTCRHTGICVFATGIKASILATRPAWVQDGEMTSCGVVAPHLPAPCLLASTLPLIYSDHPLPACHPLPARPSTGLHFPRRHRGCSLHLGRCQRVCGFW